jgi:hypothetical protein
VGDKELPEPLFTELTARTNVGQELFDQCRFSEALPVFQSAWDLLPLPKQQWNAALWTLAAIGDCYFLMRDFSAAQRTFIEAMALPEGVGNVFLHLRLGEIALELGEEVRAADELIRAYAVGGREAFDGEDPKYLEFLAAKADLLDS